MRENFKIEKELLFKNNIKDITTISLDVDYKYENNLILGNFIVSGDYRIHEISINREKFNFKIPFKHQIEDDIDNSTLKVEITDFLYDYKKDDLMVNIEYEVIGDRKDILIFDNEETLDEFLNKREVEVIDTRIEEINDLIDNDIQESEVIDVSLEENKIEEIKENEESETFDIRKVEVKDNSDLEEHELKNNDNVLNNGTEEIINNVSSIQDKFVTYKIFKIEENESLESIVLKYHTTVDELKEYNELNNLAVGDKIIIPVNE